MTVPSGLGSGHVGLNVLDLDASLDFYTDVLRLDVLGRSDAAERRYAFLGAGESLLLTLWEQAQSRGERSSTGIHHVSLIAADLAAVEEIRRAAEQRGAPFHYDGIVPHGPGMASGGIYFEDPNGVVIEVFAPVGAEHLAAPFADAPSCGLFEA